MDEGRMGSWGEWSSTIVADKPEGQIQPLSLAKVPATQCTTRQMKPTILASNGSISSISDIM